MLGKLRMTVDEAIDGFIDFGNAVFGHPNPFPSPWEPWFSSENAKAVFLRIISRSLKTPIDEPHKELFESPDHPNRAQT